VERSGRRLLARGRREAVVMRRVALLAGRPPRHAYDPENRLWLNQNIRPAA
jgi:hypothetical protein